MTSIKRTYPAVGNAPAMTVNYATAWQPMSWEVFQDYGVYLLDEAVLDAHMPHRGLVIRTSSLRWVHFLRCDCGEVLFDDGEEGNQ